MQQILTRLLEQTPTLVCSRLFQFPDPITVLELRDAPEFESEWMRVHRLLLEHDKLPPHPTEVSETIHAIEEAAFKAVYSATQAKDFTEFAPLVSDDFSLFAHAIARDFHDPWLNGLFRSYRNGKFPAGSISCVDVSIPVLLKVVT